MELTLSAEDQEFLLKMLEQHDRHLLQEIAYTDHREFRELRRDEPLLDSLVSRLWGTAVKEVRR